MSSKQAVLVRIMLHDDDSASTRGPDSFATIHDHAKLPPLTLTLSRQSTERSFRRCNTKIPTWHRRSRPTLNSLPAAGAIRKLNRGDALTTRTTFRIPRQNDGRRRAGARCFTGNIDHATHPCLKVPEETRSGNLDRFLPSPSAQLPRASISDLTESDQRAMDDPPRRSACRVKSLLRAIDSQHCCHSDGSVG